MRVVMKPICVVTLLYGLSNLFIYYNGVTTDVEEKPLLVLIALTAQILLPIICATLNGTIWTQGTTTCNALACFEISIVLQVIGDGFATAILAAWRGLPVPAGVYGVACSTALTGLSWTYNCMLSFTVLVVYYMCQEKWNPGGASELGKADSFRAFFAYVVVGYLSDRSLRMQSLTRFKLREVKQNLTRTVRKIVTTAPSLEPEEVDSMLEGHSHEPDGSPHHCKTTCTFWNRGWLWCSKSRGEESFLKQDTWSYLKGVLARVEGVTDLFSASSKRQAFFLAAMSHELRSPLTSIIGCSDLLGMTRNLHAEARELAHAIKVAGNHLLGTSCHLMVGTG